jgi:hypothetical protein
MCKYLYQGFAREVVCKRESGRLATGMEWVEYKGGRETDESIILGRVKKAVKDTKPHEGYSGYPGAGTAFKDSLDDGEVLRYLRLELQEMLSDNLLSEDLKKEINGCLCEVLNNIGIVKQRINFYSLCDL